MAHNIFGIKNRYFLPNMFQVHITPDIFGWQNK